MKITFLGTGGAFTDYRKNYQNNALVHTAAGPVLLDCGVTACQSLRELGVHPADIHTVLFTHLHGDHASPEQLIWERYYSGPRGFPAFAPTRMAGPADLLDPLHESLRPFVGIYSDPFGGVRDDGLEALLQLDRADTVTVGGVTFRFFRVPHVTSATIDKPAYGVEISDGATTALWSGDTTFSPRWIREAAERPDVKRIFHECMFLPPFHGTVHTHWAELLTLPEQALSKLTLMHHTEVPDGVDVSMIAGAARRHESFEL